MANKTIFINDSSVVDLKQFGNKEQAHFIISGTDLKFIFSDGATVNIVNGALYSSLEHSKVVFSFTDGDISGQNLLKSIDLSNLELERLDSSLSEDRQARVIKENADTKTEDEVNRLEEVNKEADKLRKEAEGLRAEAEEARKAANEVEQELQEFLDNKAKNKVSTNGSGVSNESGEEQEAASFKKKKYDEEGVAESERLKLEDNNSSSSSSSSKTSEKTGDEVIVKPVDISLKLDDKSDSGTKNDNITNIASPSFIGSTAPNANIILKIDGIVVAVVQSDNMGNFVADVASELPDGQHTIQADVEDGQGGSGSAKILVTIDTVTEIPTFELSSQYSIPVEDQIPDENLTRFTNAKIIGTAEAGVNIDIYINDILLTTVKTDAEGNWSYQFSGNELQEGINDITVVATDKADNSASTTGIITLDTIPPETPTIILDESSDTGLYSDDKITNDVTPGFRGKAGPDSIVELYVNGYKIADVTADSKGDWSYTLDSNVIFMDGTYNVQVIASDRAGNTASNAIDIEIDTNIDAFSIQIEAGSDSGNAADNYTNVASPIFTGKTDSFSHISITNTTTGETLETDASQSGNYTFRFSGESAEGVNQLIITVVDLAGNAQDYDFSYTIDTIAPVTPTIALDDYVISQSGATLTNDTTPLLVGTGEAGSHVSVYIDGKKYATVAVTAEGTWSVDVAPGLKEGEHKIVVEAQDIAGNVSLPSEEYIFSVDTLTQKPVAALDTDDDTGSSQNDWITNHNDNLLVTGVAEKYVTITLMLDGKEMGKTTADEEGHWSFEINPNPGLADDNYSVEIIAMDEVGNISSSTYELVIDTVTSTPTIMLDADSDTGITHTDGITKDPQPLFKGVAEAGAEISLMINGTYYGSAIADKNGNWSFRIPADKTLAEGEYNVMVTAVDIAGNSANSVSIPLIIDLHTDIPTIDLLSDSGDNPDDHITSVNLPSFAGTAEPFASITLYCDGNIAGKASADAKGQWQFTYPQSLPEGSYAFHVSVVDVAGNIATSEKIHVTIDTSLNIPSVDLLNESDSGASATDNITNTKSPIFVLNSVDSDVTHVLINIDGTDYPASLNNGVWSLVCPVELADGIHTITATVTDLAGNSATSGTLDVTVDTAISAPGVTLSDDTGVAGDNQTNDTTPGFAIATDSDVVTVLVSIDGGADMAAVQDSEGQWHFTVPSALTDGEHNLVVTVTDTAGNSISGEPFAFTVDTTLSVPVIDLNDGSDTGAGTTDNITNNATPAFTLSNVDADAVTVEVLINGTVYPATQTGGIWGFTAPELTDGDYAVQVRVTDDAGNVATSGALDVTVDTAISAPLITLSDDTGVAGDNQTNDTTPGFAIVTDSDAATVLVSIDGGAAQAAVRDSAGQWNFTVPSALTDGEHNLVVTVTDTAGNSISGDAFAFTVDTTLSVPVIDLTDASDSGADMTDNITNNATPAFTLSNVDADAVTVEVLINGTVYPATQTGGIWGFTAPELTDGDYAVQVRVTDDAGNVATSGALDVTVDTAISAPLITLNDDTGVAGDNQTNDTTPGFAIATDSDAATVLVSVDGGAAQSAVQDSEGQWHFTVPSALADGEHNLVVTVTDTAGNSTSGEAFAFTVDTTLSVPVIDLTDASDSGADMTDNITNNTTPAFALSQIDADAVTVEVLINGTSYPATQTGDVWSFTAPELTDGNYSVRVRVTDDAGNVAISGALNMTVDTAISAPGVTLSDDTGVAGDSQTNDTTPGFAIATDSDVVTVTVSIDGGAAQAAVQDSEGQWQFTVPSALADGEHNLVVTVTDTAGNSTSGEAFTFTVDTTLSVPVIDLTDASDSGADMTDNITNNTTPAFTLSQIDADAVRVEVLINGTVYPATKEGNVWGFTAPELTDGNYAVQVRVTDDAGNVATSGALDVTVDTAISAPGVTLSDDTGVAGDNQTNDTTPGFAIATDSDVVTVLVSVDGGAAQAAVRDSAGQWHFTVPSALADGEHNLVVTVTDTAGNSTSGEAFAFTVDTTLSLPVIDLTDGSDTGASTTDNITNNTTPAFALSQIDADAVTVEVLINGTVYPATQTGGIWGFTAPELTDGDYAVQVRATDDAGNVATSGALNMTVDTAVAPVTLVLNAGSDTGASNSDGVTHDATPTFTFSNIAADMASLTLVLSNGAEYIIDLSNGNSFTLPVSLADGVYTATAVITDVAGNTASSPVSFTVDTQLTVPVIDLAEASDSGRYSTDNITRDTTPAFVLSSIDADVMTAEVLINGTAYPATKEGGLWSFTAPVLADGDYSVQVRITDNAGNTATSVALNMTVDTAINAPVITLSDDTGTSGDNQTNDTTPGFAIVTDSDAATVMVSVDGGVAQTAVQDAAGQWHFTVPSALGDGNHSLSVTVTDLAGNSSANSLDFTIDSQLSVPTLALNSEDDSGFSNTDNLTNNTRPTFAIGNIDADVVSVVISLNGKSWPVTISQGAGTFTLPEALADGSYTVQLTVTDDAGNEKIITTPLQIDTVTSVEGIALNDDTGVLNDWLTNVTGPTFTLSAPADAQTVAVSVDGGAAIQATYSEGGWVINLPDGLSDGEHTLQVTVTDKAGNTAQRDQIFAVDTTLEPLGVDMLNQDDSGTVDDNITHVTTPRFSLTGVPEDVFGITVSLNGASYSVTPQSDGSWVFMPPVALDDGEYQLLAVVTDNAGNQRTTSFSFVIDTSVSIDNITLLNDTGDSSTDSITNAGQPHFNVATSDDVVTMTATINGIACNVTQTATGIWSVTSPVLTTPGDYTLTVNVTDVAGNQTTSTKTITFDNQLSQPVVSFVTGDDTGYDTNDHLTGKNRPGFVITNIDDDVTGMSVVLNGKTTQIYADGTGNWTFTPDQVLNDGTYTLSVNLHDRAGNTSSKDFTFTVDTTVAKAIITMDEQSDTGDSQTDHLTNNRSPEFTFTNIDADVYKVQVVLNGTTYEVSKDPQDAWHWAAPELAAGTYTLSTLVTDKAGNQSSESMTFVIDTYVQIDSIQMSADTGYADNDHLTYDSRPDFTIQVSDDVSHVYVSLDGTTPVELTKTNGEWIFSCPAELSDGAHAVNVQVIDAAGNTAYQQVDFVVDTTLMPVTIDLRDEDDSGNSSVDNYTRNTQPVFLFQGIPADAHSMVAVLDGQRYEIDLSLSPVSFKPPASLQDGSYTLEVELTDNAGNTAESSIIFNVDTQTSVSVDFAAGDDTGRSDNDNCTTQNMPTFDIAVPEDVTTVLVALDNGTQTSILKDSSGKWLFTTPVLTDGVHNIVVSVTDKAGNTAQTTLDFTVDTTLNMPLIDLISDSGYLTNDNLTNDATPKFEISNVDSDVWSVVVLLNGKSYPASRVDGTWVCQIPDADALSDGNYVAEVRIEDQAGNTRSGSLNFVIDTVCPSPVVSLSDADNSGDKSDNITNVAQPRLIISDMPEDIYQVSVTLGGETWQIEPQAGGWDVPQSLADGTYSAVVSFTDKAGNTSSTTYSFVVDTTVQSPGLVLLDDTGSNVTDNLTNVTAPRFEITAAEPLVSVRATLNGITVNVEQQDGRWIYTAESLADGSYTLQVEWVDIAGNHVTDDLTFTVDTQIPTPVIDLSTDSDSGSSASDNITNDPQPVFVISNVPDDVDSIRVNINGTSYIATMNSADQWTVRPNNLPDGEYTATVIMTDNAGNQAENSISFVIDTQIALSMEMDPASDTGVSHTDHLTNDVSPTFSGNTESHAQIVISIKDNSGTVMQTVEQQANADGSWSFTAADLADGQYTISVRATDVAGNSTEQSMNFVIDTLVATPTIGLTESDANNSHEALGLAPEFSGMAEAGSNLSIKIDGMTVASVTVSANGTWAWTPPSSFLSGDHVIAVTATDKAGNISSETSFNFIIPVVDLDPPTVMLSNDTDSGSLGDFITNNTKPVITGITLPGVTVTLYINGVAVGAAQSDSTGRYSYELPVMAEGIYSLQASIIDPNSQEALLSDSANLVVDTHVEPLEWSISGMTDEGYISDNTPTVSGISEPGAKIKIYVDGKFVIETSTSSDGTWSVRLPVIGNDGSHEIAFTVNDLAGNTMQIDPTPLILDSYISPLTLTLRESDDTGSSSTDLITNKTTVNLEGVAEAGAVLTLYGKDGSVLTTLTVGDDGQWSYSVELSEGANTFIAIAEDSAGNKVQKDIIIQCDTHNSISDVALARESNSGDIGDMVTNDKTPTLSAMTDPGASVDIYVNEVKVATVVADASGLASYTLPESEDGNYNVTFISTDAAGNTVTSATSVVVIDTAVSGFEMTAPPELINSRALELTGTGEINSTVTIRVNGAVIGRASVDAEGNWNMPVVLGEDGEYIISATLTDIAGNVVAGEDYPVTLDSHTDYPTISLNDETNSASKGDNITNINPPAFHGTAEAGATVNILVDEVMVATIVADADGNWSWAYPGTMNDGEYSVRVIAEDVAGNTAESARILVTIDTETDIQIQGMADDGGYYANDYYTGSTRPTFNITGEKNQPVSVYIDGEYVETITPGSISSTYTVPADLDDGSHSIRFEITDAAGNTASTESRNFTIDTVNDTPIVLTTINGQPVETITVGDVTYLTDITTNATLTGKAEAGSYLNITVNGLTVNQFWVGEDGNWTASINKMVLQDGELNIKFNSTDKAGNEKETSMVIVVDTRIDAFSVNVEDNKSTTADKWALNNQNVTFFGRGEAGSTVTVFLAGVAVASVMVAADGTWAMEPTSLADGNYSLSFKIEDPAGNTQIISHDVTIDTQAPAVPVVDTSAFIDGSGLWVMSGTAEAGSKLVVEDETGKVIASVTADSNGNWSTVFNYPDGGKVTLHAEDAVGNISPDVTFDEMRAVPALTLDIASDSGIIGDMITSNTMPTLLLQNIESDVTQVVVTLNGQSYNALQSGQGIWSLTFTEPLPEGRWSVMVTATDAAGNSQSATVMLEIDHSLSLPEVVLDGMSDTGSVGDMLTNNATPTLVLQDIDADVTQVIVTINSQTYNAVQGEEGGWSLTLPDALPEGTWPVTVTVTDDAGNSQTTVTELTIDQSLSVPVAAMESDTGGDHIVNDNTPGFILTDVDADADSVTVNVNGNNYDALKSDDGEWSFTPPEPLTDGEYHLVITTTDVAGNVSHSEPFDFIIDTQIDTFDARLVNNEGDQPDEWRSESHTLDIAGQGEAGATVSASIDGGEAIHIQVDEQGDWSLQMSDIADGTHSLQLGIVDKAGNTQQIEYSVTVDTSSALLMATMQDEPESDTKDSVSHDQAAAVMSAEIMTITPIDNTTHDDQQVDHP